MVGKLMKYDLRCCFRRFGALWIAIAALAVVNGILLHGPFDKLQQSGGIIRELIAILPPTALIILLIATAVLSFIFMCERFYNGLFGDEGYLMFTLPARISEHIAAKALSSLILWIISAVIALASGLLFLVIWQPAETMQALRMLPEALRQIQIPAAFPLLIAECLVLILVGCAEMILKVYAAIAIGHLIGGRRKIIAILSYFGLSIIESMLLNAFIFAREGLGIAAGLEDSDWGIMYAAGEWSVKGAGLAAGVFGVLILMSAVLGIIYFVITKMILSRRLNLE